MGCSVSACRGGPDTVIPSAEGTGPQKSQINLIKPVHHGRSPPPCPTPKNIPEQVLHWSVSAPEWHEDGTKLIDPEAAGVPFFVEYCSPVNEYPGLTLDALKRILDSLTADQRYLRIAVLTADLHNVLKWKYPDPHQPSAEDYEAYFFGDMQSALHNPPRPRRGSGGITRTSSNSGVFDSSRLPGFSDNIPWKEFEGASGRVASENSKLEPLGSSLDPQLLRSIQAVNASVHTTLKDSESAAKFQRMWPSLVLTRKYSGFRNANIHFQPANVAVLYSEGESLQSIYSCLKNWSTKYKQPADLVFWIPFLCLDPTSIEAQRAAARVLLHSRLEFQHSPTAHSTAQRAVTLSGSAGQTAEIDNVFLPGAILSSPDRCVKSDEVVDSDSLDAMQVSSTRTNDRTQAGDAFPTCESAEKGGFAPESKVALAMKDSSSASSQNIMPLIDSNKVTTALHDPLSVLYSTIMFDLEHAVACVGNPQNQLTNWGKSHLQADAKFLAQCEECLELGASLDWAISSAETDSLISNLLTSPSHLLSAVTLPTSIGESPITTQQRSVFDRWVLTLCLELKHHLISSNNEVIAWSSTVPEICHHLCAFERILDAVALAKKLYSARKSVMQFSNSMTADAALLVANMLLEKGEFEEPLMYLDNAFIVFNGKSEQFAKELAYLDRAYARTYQGQGVSKVAIEYFEKSISEFSKQAALKEAGVDAAHMKASLALLVQGSGHLDYAASLFQQATSELDALAAPIDRAIVNANLNYAVLMKSQGLYSRSCEQLEKTLAMGKAALGDYHDDTLCCYLHMIDCHNKNNAIDRVCAIIETVLSSVTSKDGFWRPAFSEITGFARPLLSKLENKPNTAEDSWHSRLQRCLRDFDHRRIELHGSEL